MHRADEASPTAFCFWCNRALGRGPDRMGRPLVCEACHVELVQRFEAQQRQVPDWIAEPVEHHPA